MTKEKDQRNPVPGNLLAVSNEPNIWLILAATEHGYYLLNPRKMSWIFGPAAAIVRDGRNTL